jgi:hypothetical protein
MRVARARMSVLWHDGLDRLTFIGFGLSASNYESTIGYTRPDIDQRTPFAPDDYQVAQGRE